LMKIQEAIGIIIRSTYDQVLNCLRYELHCLDPPSVTSGMLDKYGVESYAKKLSFWRTVDNIISRYDNTVLFKGKFGVFRLAIVHEIEEVYRVENEDIYVDPLDCDYLSCSATPRSHSLRIYLEGVYSERVILRINIITLLKMAVAEAPYYRECLEEFVEDPLSLGKVLKLANCSLSVLTRHRAIYDILFNKKPGSGLDILRHSPILRRYVSDRIGESPTGNSRRGEK